MRRFGLICFAACLAVCAQAQIMIVPREKLDAVNNPRLSKDAASLKFETVFIEAEPMGEDDGIKTFVFPFENIGMDTISVKRLVSTCSCASAVCTVGTLLPGTTAEVVVKYNPKGHPGAFERKVFLYTDDSPSPAAILRLSVKVERGADMSGLYPVSMGNIRVRTREIAVKKDVRTTVRCVFVNVSDKPLKLECEKAMLPSCLTVKSEPEIVAGGQEGEIVITYDPSLGAARAKMPVMLKGLGVPPSQSTITVTVN